MQNKFLEDKEWIGEVLDANKIGLWTILQKEETGEEAMFVSEAMMRLLGLFKPLEPTECLHHWKERVLPQDRSYVETCIEKMIDTGDFVELSYNWEHEWWGKILLQGGGRAKRKPDGTLEIKGYYKNISEIESLKEITQNIPDGICVIDLDSLKIIYGNESFYALYDCTEKRLYENHAGSIESFLEPEEKARVFKIIKEAMDAGKKNVEFEVESYRSDKKKLCVLIKGTLIKTADSMQLSCVLIDLTEHKKAEQDLLLNERLLSTALEQTASFVFDIDIQKRKAVLKNGNMGTVALGNVLDDVIDNLLASKLIHKDYETVWLDMWSELCAGTERVSREILVRYSKKRPYVWKRLVLQTIYKEKGVPLRAVGVLEDISLQKKIELAFIKERKYRKAMLAETLAFTEVNVSKNVVEKSTGVWERTKAHRRMSYDEILERVAKKRVYEEDREGYLSMLNRENLMNAYNSGRMELRCEHREIDFEGKLRWVKLTVYLVKDPISNDLKALAHLKDIDGRKTRELTMQYQSERDSLTGLYNKGTAEELTKDFLQKEAREDACHAFVILDLDDFKSLNDNHGHQFGDEVLKTTAQILKDIFRSDDIEGRLGGDEMVVLMKNIPDRQCVEERMGVLKERLQEISKDKTSVTASIGISLFGEHGNEYHELYRTADLALYRAKKQGRNQFVIYETNMGNEKE